MTWTWFQDFPVLVVCPILFSFAAIIGKLVPWFAAHEGHDVRVLRFFFRSRRFAGALAPSLRSCGVRLRHSGR